MKVVTGQPHPDRARRGPSIGAALMALAQGLWPKFPGMKGAPSVRISSNAPANAYASAQ